MPLTREQAQRVAARIAAAPALLPQTAEGRTELVDAILRHCSDADHAKNVMTEVLDGALKPVNLVAEIAMIAGRTRRPDQPPPGCQQCDVGEDITTGATRWSPFVHVQIRGYSAARRCDCARGRWLAARDQERQLGETPQMPRAAVTVPVDSKAAAAGEWR